MRRVKNYYDGIVLCMSIIITVVIFVFNIAHTAVEIYNRYSKDQLKLFVLAISGFVFLYFCFWFRALD